nr:hypothetical protein [Tanacetum cinerariifolium]
MPKMRELPQHATSQKVRGQVVGAETGGGATAFHGVCPCQRQHCGTSLRRPDGKKSVCVWRKAAVP